MHIDPNSAFATAEQQAHLSLRGKPTGVTNRLSKECCVIAASYEAKALGIKVGTRLSNAKAICPEFIMSERYAPKYHRVYEQLKANRYKLIDKENLCRFVFSSVKRLEDRAT